MVALWSLTRAVVVILSLLQENNFSKSIPDRVKCRTNAVNHLSRSLETWKMLKIILSKLKCINKQNPVIPQHTKLRFNMNLAMYNLPSNLKSSLHKMWQTLLLFLKPLQIHNLKRKKWGDMAYYIPATWKSGGTRPPCSPPNCAHVPNHDFGPDYKLH